MFSAIGSNGVTADVSRRRLLSGVVLALSTAGCLGVLDGGGDGESGDAGDDATPTTAEPTTSDETEPETATTTTTTVEHPETAPLPEAGAEHYVDRVERFDSTGNDHVSAEESIDYGRVPPTSGPHFSGVVTPGFYKREPPLGALVHNLEHGAVVVYYDPDVVTESARESLAAFADEHTDPWAHVVVAPSPAAAPAPYTLTAWRHRLRLQEYDPRAVRAFLAEYLGRGPERPVR